MLDNIFKKILTVVIVIFIIHFFFFNLVLAEENTSVKFTPQVGIPGTEFQKGAEIPIPGTTAKIGEYIKGFYIFIISALAILSVIMIAWAGITWLTAGGSAEKVGAAKAHILSALGGLALGLVSYVILQTINPDLVSFRTSNIKPVPAENCCQETSSTCSYKSQTECTAMGGKWLNNYICGSEGKCVLNTESQAITCDNTSGECKSICSGSEEVWKNIKCGTSGEVCCVPKNNMASCGNIPGAQTFCRPLSGTSGCLSGERPYLANCPPEQTCCINMVNLSGCSFSGGEGVCFRCAYLMGVPVCSITYCPDPYYYESNGICNEGYKCCAL